MKHFFPLFLLIATLAHAGWKPAEAGLLTRWAAQVSPESVWAEYPRPQLRRADWSNLNGLWDYSITSEEAVAPDDWAGEILVPFCPEAALSGVGRLIEPTEALWYQRALPTPVAGKRMLLHFEAVDYETTVWVNDVEIGTHRGGFTPFSFDITDALKPAGNVVRVRAYDATGGFQLLGKQRLHPQGTWYSRVSGIWQTVWLAEQSRRLLATYDVADLTTLLPDTQKQEQPHPATPRRKFLEKILYKPMHAIMLPQ